ncbi:hypothetical protein [Paenibacillus maysiensis]|uniref:hypothetical protein n=1 Tax=Paenibacillus maysiensis TaxID=1155954 RepID=UPI000472DE06|nr:hypothetical protein [Paenibacillus maysiensis]
MVAQRYPYGQDGMRAFAKLDSLKERPHAIMTTNDFVACGIISAARSKGWNVPYVVLAVERSV